MGREPLGLTPSGKVGCPGPPSAPPALKLWLPSQTKKLGSPAVSGRRGRQWLVLQKNLQRVSSSWPEPASPPSALKLGMLAKPNMLPRISNFGYLGCSGQSLGAKISQCFGLTFPARPPQAP
eukprot:1155737-Pelagomonas_calceolata.AAC.3